jgi:hypothetical protein
MLEVRADSGCELVESVWTRFHAVYLEFSSGGDGRSALR